MTFDGGFQSERSVFIVADDLTGALDTAGVFASPSNPVDVFLTPPAGSGWRRVSLDLDTRDVAEAAAAKTVGRAFRDMLPADAGTVAFKKLDSVLRGNPIAETIAAYRSGRFDTVLFAPAFPAMGRITADGQQYVVTASGRKAVGPPLLDAFAAHGLKACLLADGAGGADIRIADAESDADLATALRQLPPHSRILFAGSAGLASIVAGGSAPPVTVPPVELAICGTGHPVTLGQVEALRGHGVAIHQLDDDCFPTSDRPLVLTAGHAQPTKEALWRIGRSIRKISGRIPRPRAALVTGGWTLRLLLEASGAERLICVGQCSIGIPICHVVGGRWDGVPIVSKSGGFGSPELLWRLFEAGRAAGRANGRQPDPCSPGATSA